VLPGEPEKVAGFKREGPNAVSFVLDGNQLLAAAEKSNALDNNELRKQLRSGSNASSPFLKEFGGWDLAGMTATMAKPGQPQFDYDQEVKAARAAYPELRKKLRLPDDVRLPGEPAPDVPKK
ncbi:MAG TPA: hypothetical protein VKE74_07375, partial [Gemmataceae bacterium]|nr:hypothetical protein [Gemmataceae bacterium]